MKWSFAGVFAGILAFSGCVHRPPPAPPLAASPHYFLGDPYEADGHWYYPSENYALATTGLASVQGDGKRLTADGEIDDGTALTAAMQTIQLPAIASVTNLENGRQIKVRVNDRGPANPARIIALSPRAALLLAMPPSGVARVRVELDTVLSHRVVDQLGGGPKLAIQAAPPGTVIAQALPPPGGGPAGATEVIGAAPVEAAPPPVPDRLPEFIHQYPPDPGQLWLRAGTFGRFEYANTFAAKLSRLGGDVLRLREGRHETYAVRAGPFRTTAEADAALREAEAAGVTDARITVE